MNNDNYFRIISRLDIKEANLVKGVQLEGLRILGKANFFSEKYYKDNIDEIFYQDCVASLYGNNMLFDLISKVSKSIFIPITVGGGIKNIDDIITVLKSGADKVSINTAAFKNINFIKQAIQVFGSSTIVISIEANKLEDGNYYCFTESGRNNSGVKVKDWVQEIQSYGVGEIIMTMVNTDGTGEGFDVDFITKINHKLSIPLIVHGGCGDKHQVLDLQKNSKIDGISIASMFHYEAVKSYHIEDNIKLFKPSKKINPCSINSLKKYLLDHDINCRL